MWEYNVLEHEDVARRKGRNTLSVKLSDFIV